MTSKLETQHTIQSCHACSTRGDAAGIAAFLAENVEFQSPMMRFSTATDLVASSVSFQPFVVAYLTISKLYEEGEGILLYDLEMELASHFLDGSSDGRTWEMASKLGA